MSNAAGPISSQRRLLRIPGRSSEGGRRLPLGRQLLLQLFCLLVAASVLFPVMWIVSMSLDPRNIARPTELRLIPPGASLKAYTDVIKQPTANPVSFWRLAFNSFKLAGGVSLMSVLVGVSAAYVLSRFRFRGRQTLMLSFVLLQIMPGVATLAPLFVMLNSVRMQAQTLNLVLLIFGISILLGGMILMIFRLRETGLSVATIVFGLASLVVGGALIRSGLAAAGPQQFILRQTLFGVGLAMISGGLPFAVWNLKGYLDTIPKELEEAAIIDGASPNQVFFRVILPLAIPALAVTAFLGFMTGWTEFFLSWQFLTNPQDFTLAMALWNMTGQYAGSVPWSKFAAMAILVSLPVSAVYLGLQRYIVGGLTLGGVKG